MTHTPQSIRKITLITTGALLASATALAAAQGTADSALSRYRQELASCNTPSTQDPAACRKEARAALAAARRGTLAVVDDPAQFEKNALRRCEAHQGVDRTACEARMRGEGNVEGSVEAGGILRELEVEVPTS